jgi:dTDP-4-amino-4,6-dideoxygalactose transaminase
MTTTVTSVPLLDLQAQYAPIRDEILAAISTVCDSQRFIGGPEIDALERELATMLQVKAAIGVSSGTDALLAAFMALNIGPGDEVVTTTYSFFATAGTIWRVGARPVLVDIDPLTCNIDPEAATRAITPRTRAILPVHLYGQSAEMDPIVEVASRHGVAIIEDAAQAIGARYKGRPVGGIGTIGCFSFFPSKNLGAFGDGGLLTTNDEALAHRLRLMRNHGAEPKYFHKFVGGNFRLDALQAAVLRIKAKHLPAWTEARRRKAVRYRQLFDEAGLSQVPASGSRAGVPAIGLPVEVPGRYHIYNQFIIRVPDRPGAAGVRQAAGGLASPKPNGHGGLASPKPNGHGGLASPKPNGEGGSTRDRLRAYLEARRIGVEIYYPVPFHLQECFAALGHREGEFPEAERAARETLALPIYGELTEAQQRYVVGSIVEFMNGPKPKA